MSSIAETLEEAVEFPRPQSVESWWLGSCYTISRSHANWVGQSSSSSSYPKIL